MNAISESDGLLVDVAPLLPAEQLSGGETRHRIFSVDDSQDNLLLVEMILEVEGDYEVESFSNGDAAIDAIRKAPPSLLLLDFMMPGMTGLEVIEQLNHELDCRQFPIVVISAKDRDTASIVLDAGASDFIHKPIAIDSFMDVVRTQLGD